MAATPTVIASEAKRWQVATSPRTWLPTAGGSRHLHLQRRRGPKLDCFVASLLAMTAV
jgi:hypothetical protein